MKFIKENTIDVRGGIKTTIRLLGIPIIKKYDTVWEKKTYILGIKIRGKYLPPVENKDLEDKTYVFESMIKSLETEIAEIKQRQSMLESKLLNGQKYSD